MNDMVQISPPELPQGLDSAASMSASYAAAVVQARCVMAVKRPRNWDQVRQSLMLECRTPAFANDKSAYYIKPIGDGAEGLGIRFAEAALRCMTNVAVEMRMKYEDHQKEVHEVTVTDLETNYPMSTELVIAKTVERSFPSDDGSYISVRKNSRGKNVYTVVAREDDMLNKRGAARSKALREATLRMLPAALKSEAIQVILAIRADDAARDPSAARKAIVDAFGEIGVSAENLVSYLGHPIEQCAPAQLVSLRGLYGAIRDGEATWAQAMENKASQDSGEGPKEYPQADFDRNLPKWREFIESGKQTPAQIAAKASTKGQLTKAQQKALNDIQPANQAQEEQQ